MREPCEYCGGRMTIEYTDGPRGETVAYGAFCQNRDCDGDDTPQCDECSDYLNEINGNHPHVNEYNENVGLCYTCFKAIKEVA